MGLIFKDKSVNRLLTLAVGIYSTLSVSTVMAQAGGLSIGINPVSEIVCVNKTTEQEIKLTNPAGASWDCAAMGLSMSPGDIVKQTVKGDVSSPSKIGGSVYGVTAITKLKCDNKTTNLEANIVPATYNWNCINTGLVMNVGDVVKQTIQGTVDQLATTPPSAPVALSAVIGDSAITLSWAVSAGADFYHIYSASDPLVVLTTLVGETNISLFIHNGLINGITYTYAVTSVNALGESVVSNLFPRVQLNT